MSLANLCFVVNSLVRNGHLKTKTTIIAGVAGSDQSDQQPYQYQSSTPWSTPILLRSTKTILYYSITTS